MLDLNKDDLAKRHYDKLPDQIQWKLYRARLHFEEFQREASVYMNVNPSGPGKMVPAPESTPEKPLFIYAPEEPVPTKFGLIAGDFLQNLRSVLDYLVWQLVIANKQVPHKKNTSFPVCSSRKSWEQCKERKLKGLTVEQVGRIEALQPYPDRQKGAIPQTIAILDELTNENKHRQILFTSLGSRVKPNLPPGIPHIELEVSRNIGGQMVVGESLLVYLAFQGGIVKGLEVTATLCALMDWIGFDVLPQFEKFF